MPPGSSRSATASTPSSPVSPGVQEEQRERALVEQRRPVGGQHVDLGVVGEDLAGGLGQLGVELGGDDAGTRRAPRSAARPCPPRSRCRTRPGCRCGSPPARPAGGRSRCGRTTRSRRGATPRRPATRSWAGRGVRSWGRVLHPTSRVSNREMIVPIPWARPSAAVVPWPNHAERVRTHRLPRRGLVGKATSPRCSALRWPCSSCSASCCLRGGSPQVSRDPWLPRSMTGPRRAIRGPAPPSPPPRGAPPAPGALVRPAPQERFRCSTTCTPSGDPPATTPPTR